MDATGAPRSVRPEPLTDLQRTSSSPNTGRRRHAVGGGIFADTGSPICLADSRRRPPGAQHHPGPARPAARPPAVGAPAEVLLIHPARGRELDRDGQAGQRPCSPASGWSWAGIRVETLEVLRRRPPPGTFHRRHRRSRRWRGFGRLPFPPYITRDRRGRTSSAIRRSTPRPGQRRRADRRAALHRPRCSTRSRAPGCRDRETRPQVGPGTFKPVEAERSGEHPMHPERFEIPRGSPRLMRALRERAAGLGGGHHRGPRARERGRPRTAGCARAAGKPAS